MNTAQVTVPSGPAPEMAIWLLEASTHYPIAVCRTHSNFSFRAPPGSYELAYSRLDDDSLPRQMFGNRFSVKEGRDELELGSLEIELPHLIESYGRVLAGEEFDLAHTRVGTHWLVDTSICEQMLMTSGEETGTDGLFRFSEEIWDPSGTLMLSALDASQTHGALFEVDLSGGAGPFELRLEPLVKVTGQLLRPGAKESLWTNVYIQTEGGRRFAQCRSMDGRITFALSPGSYVLEAYGIQTETLSIPIELAQGTEGFDLGDVSLTPSVLAKLMGKPAPPWKVSAARGLESSVSVADFRGRWLLIEFWGYW